MQQQICHAVEIIARAVPELIRVELLDAVMDFGLALGELSAGLREKFLSERTVGGHFPRSSEW